MVSDRWGARFLRERFTEVFREMKAVEKPDPASWNSNGITMAWLGHATVLIQFYGFWILTDPSLFSRVGLDLRLMTLGPKRFYASPLLPREIPAPDLILLSHAHMDHMDLPSLRCFDSMTPTITASQTADILEGTLSSVQELKWGESTVVKRPVGDLKITAFEVNHWGARWQKDLYRGYNGYVLEREGKKLIFGGDTAMSPTFKALKSQGPYETAMMPIGAYDPWIRSHCNPEQAVTMAQEAGARSIAPIHFKTFKLSRENPTEPMQRLEKACEEGAFEICWKEIGESRAVL